MLPCITGFVSVVYTAMTGAEAAAADSHDLDEVEDIELDQASDRDSTVGSKRKGGRPVDRTWDSFKRVANPNVGASNRAWIAIALRRIALCCMAWNGTACKIV